MGLKLTFRLTGAISYIKSCMLRCRNPISCQLNLKLHVPDKYIDNQITKLFQLFYFFSWYLFDFRLKTWGCWNRTLHRFNSTTPENQMC